MSDEARHTLYTQAAYLTAEMMMQLNDEGGEGLTVNQLRDRLLEVLKSAVADAFEDCASIADKMAAHSTDESAVNTAKAVAAAIRAERQKTV